MMKLIPFAVRDQDYWVSLPLEGMTAAVGMMGLGQSTPYILYRRSIKTILKAAMDRVNSRCKFCSKRLVRRYFLILGPPPEERVRGFVVCENCADQMRIDVTSG